MRFWTFGALVFVLSACGGGNGSSPSNPSPVTTPTPTSTYNVQVRVTNDMPFTLTIRNQNVTSGNNTVLIADGTQTATGAMNGKGSLVVQFASGSSFASTGVTPFSFTSLSGPFQISSICSIVYNNPNTTSAGFSFSFRSGFSTTANVC